MKRNFLHISIAYLFSALFLFAGSGYNIMHYCADNCQLMDVEYLSQLCCEEHDATLAHHHHQGDSHSQRDDDCDHDLDEACHVHRLRTDVPSIEDNSEEYFVDYTLLFADFIFADILPSSDDELGIHTNKTIPPILPDLQAGRYILSVKRVLVI